MLKRIWKKWWVKALVIIHLIVFIGSAAGFFYIKHTAADDFKRGKLQAPFDAIIVPGYPFQGTTWHDIMKIRVYWSKYLKDKGLAKHIIYSGGAVYTPYIESEIMKSYAEALGMPSEDLFSETMAEHSTENLIYSLKLGHAQGFKKIALATDPFQSFFLKQYANKFDLKIEYLPIQLETLDSLNLVDPMIDASGAMADNFVALPERESFFERLRGTFGQNINSADR